MTHSLAEVQQAQREHQAWLIACRELKREGIDINENEPIHAALVVWGEELAQLRSMQDGQVRVNAQADARRQFNMHIGFLPDVLAGAYTESS